MVHQLRIYLRKLPFSCFFWFLSFYLTLQSFNIPSCQTLTPTQPPLPQWLQWGTVPKLEGLGWKEEVQGERLPMCLWCQWPPPQACSLPLQDSDEQNVNNRRLPWHHKPLAYNKLEMYFRYRINVNKIGDGVKAGKSHVPGVLCVILDVELLDSSPAPGGTATGQDTYLPLRRSWTLSPHCKSNQQNLVMSISQRNTLRSRDAKAI